MAKPEELEVGGSCFLKTAHTCHPARVLDILRAAAKIRLEHNDREMTVPFNQLMPDREWLEGRAQRALENKRRNAEEREPKPLTHKLVIPAPTPKPQPAPKLERLADPDNAEATRRMIALFRWLAATRFEGKRGSIARVEELFGIVNISGIMRGHGKMAVRTAMKALEHAGIDQRYLLLADFVMPDAFPQLFKPAPAAAPPDTGAQVLVLPQPKPAAEPTTAPPSQASRLEALRQEIRAWREMSPIASVKSELSANLKAIAAKEHELSELKKTQTELMTALGELETRESFEEAAAE